MSDTMKVMSKAEVIELLHSVPDDLLFRPVELSVAVAEWGENAEVKLYRKTAGIMIHYPQDPSGTENKPSAVD